MKQRLWVTAFFSVALSASCAFGISISELRQNGADGIVDEISGIVVELNGEPMNYHMGRIHIQDTLGELYSGIMLIDQAENSGTGVLARSLQVGDMVTLYNVAYESGGAFGNDVLYYDLEGSNNSYSVTPNVGLPEPIVVTPDQLFGGEAASVGAEYQSMLVKVNGVSIAAMGVGAKSDNYAIVDKDGNTAWAGDYVNSDKLFVGNNWKTKYHHYTCPDTPEASTSDPYFNPISDDGYGGVGQYFASITGIMEKYQNDQGTYSYYQFLTTCTDSFTFAIPGDANNDGIVDGSDVTILAGNWQSENVTWWDGDFNKDGKVDGSDVTILAGNWQKGIEPSSSSVAVPEPGGWALLAVLLLSTGLFFVIRR